jgi:ribosomal protein S18 acetylase RimI-like enzyme
VEELRTFAPGTQRVSPPEINVSPGRGFSLNEVAEAFAPGGEFLRFKLARTSDKRHRLLSSVPSVNRDSSLPVRRAGVADAAALTRLRALMLSDMGLLTAGSDPAWRDQAEEWFGVRLADRANFAAFVVDKPGVGVVSCAAGICDHHAPGPGNPGGVQGHVFNMSTEPGHRRRGCARACLEALLAWFRDETGAGVISLSATSDGVALYRSLGFTEPRQPYLQLRPGQ